MMGNGKFADEFKQEAVRQVVERGYSVSCVAKRLGISVQSLYINILRLSNYGYAYTRHRIMLPAAGNKTTKDSIAFGSCE